MISEPLAAFKLNRLVGGLSVGRINLQEKVRIFSFRPEMLLGKPCKELTECCL